ncbi:MAG: hypothetical protein M1826_005591 [Phylliscum demangeonii]|nr:MAG: hypothetical protein M1826_005591 [Phylliscum demangeonii]
MALSRWSFLAGALGLIGRTAGHGTCNDLLINGTTYDGIHYGQGSKPNSPGWALPETPGDHAFVGGKDYGDSSINCHYHPIPAAVHAPLTAGDTVEFQWNSWPENGHVGPILTYMANCHKPCNTVNLDDLEWFKIDQAGLVKDLDKPGPIVGAPPATFATDVFRNQQNSHWPVKTPATIEPGYYLIRNEIISLSLAFMKDGVQNYPQCFSLLVASQGTDRPVGVKGTNLYKDTDPGIALNIFNPIGTYQFPGPPLYTPGASQAPVPAPAPAPYSAAVSSSTTGPPTDVAAAASASASPSSTSPVSVSVSFSTSATDTPPAAPTPTPQQVNYNAMPSPVVLAGVAASSCAALPAVTSTSMVTVTVTIPPPGSTANAVAAAAAAATPTTSRRHHSGRYSGKKHAANGGYGHPHPKASPSPSPSPASAQGY